MTALEQTAVALLGAIGFAVICMVLAIGIMLAVYYIRGFIAGLRGRGRND